MQTFKGYLQSEVGCLEIICSDEGLNAINFIENCGANDNFLLLDKVIEQLQEYFSGERKTFDIPLVLEGTEFQKKVWNELLKIPYGKTVSYQYIAKSINHDKAVRAVGSANGKNKIPIIIPCHRVIGLNGKLSGYAGGIWRKEKLIAIEKK